MRVLKWDFFTKVTFALKLVYSACIIHGGNCSTFLYKITQLGSFFLFS